ncbi:MAG: membrane protein insertase YidC [Verrucomicrobiota bacterium]|jgi:YidC/Oxa1 family membrane protein insertase
MDRKSIIILAVAVAMLLVLSPVVDHFFPPKPVPITVQPIRTNQPAETAMPAAQAPAPAAAPAARKGPPAGPEETLTVSNADLIWHFTSRGGGLKTVDLTKYPAAVSPPSARTAKTSAATLNQNAPAPVLSVAGEGLETDDDFILTLSGATVRAERTLSNGLRVVKEFEIGSNYLFKARLSFENTGAQPLAAPAREVVIGTSTAIGPLDDPTAMGTFWYNGVKTQNIKEGWFANRTLGCIPGTPRAEYVEGTNNVQWAAVHNQFFALAAIPSNPAPRIVIRKTWVAAPELNGLSNAMSATLTNGYQAALVYPAAALAAHQTLTEAFTFYAGPKEYNRLAQIGQKMGNNLDLIMDFTGPFGFFSKLLLLWMNGLHAMGLSYGLTIIAITVIIKLVFWPLTNASTKSQKRMQALQPQLKAIADKYKDDPVKKNEKTMAFWKEHKINPMGSCLPTLLQIPVFFGFYWMLRNAIELRGVSFLWAYDLSQPDTVAHLAGFPVNPLPLIMGATQLWLAQLMPASPGMDPAQQKIMKFMPLMFIALLYRMSAGLTLYWTVQNLLSILQTKITKTNEPPATAPAPGAVKKMK